MTLRHSPAGSVPSAGASSAEDGFLLLGAIVAIALVLLALSIAAPIVARELRRDREVEAVHRGNQYVRAIQLYYRKFGHYPGSIDQLQNTNNIRFLRQRYADPITGKDDFRTIPVGQNKTTVKTFFGQPLTGIGGGGAGSVSGMLSQGMGGAGSTIGAPSTSSALGSTGFGTPAASLSSSATGAAAGNATAASGAAATAGTSNGQGGAADAAASTASSGAAGSTGTAEPPVFSGGGAPIMGVGFTAKGDSIVEPNEQTTYETWEFLYDPRLDQLRAKAAAANGGGLGSVPSNSLGGSNSIFGSATGSTPASTGTTSGSTATTSGATGAASAGTQP